MRLQSKGMKKNLVIAIKRMLKHELNLQQPTQDH